jgi:hypothetical protein
MVLICALLAIGAGAGSLAASGVFSGTGESATTSASRVTVTAPAARGPAPKRGNKKTPTGAAAPVGVTPAPRPTGLQPFQTGISPGRTLPATYCEVRPTTGGSVLYCWTPIDGYTIEVPSNGFSQRLRSDEATNRGRTASGYSRLGIDQQTSGDGFTCSSRTKGLTCTNAGGHGFDLPRDKGLPAQF